MLRRHRLHRQHRPVPPPLQHPEGDRLPTPDETRQLHQAPPEAPACRSGPRNLRSADAEEGRSGSWLRERWRPRVDGRGGSASSLSEVSPLGGDWFEDFRKLVVQGFPSVEKVKKTELGPLVRSPACCLDGVELLRRPIDGIQSEFSLLDPAQGGITDHVEIRLSFH